MPVDGARPAGEALAAQSLRTTAAAQAASAAAAEAAELEETVGALATDEAAAESAATAARDRMTDAEARLAESTARLATARAQVAAADAHLEALERRLQSDLPPALLGAITAAGGRRVDDGLEVDADLRRAVAAALGDILTAMTASASVIGDLEQAPGAFVIDGSTAARAARERESTAVLGAVAAAGGGQLGAAIRRVTRRVTSRDSWSGASGFPTWRRRSRCADRCRRAGG